MFSGIVKGIGAIAEITEREGLKTFGVDIPQELTENLKVGASVSIDGVCLTVTGWRENRLFFDLMMETLNITTLGQSKLGDAVNVERSLRYGDEIGGHAVSGHVDGKAKIIAISQPDNNYIIDLQFPEKARGYLFSKGYIALNGTSLTLCDVNQEQLTARIYLIPETLRMTTFGQKSVGSEINFEIDRQTQAIVDTGRAVAGR